MIIIEGLFYLNRAGGITGPMESSNNDALPWRGKVAGIDRMFSADGRHCKMRELDLVEEYAPPRPD